MGERAQNDNLFRPLIKLETQIKVSRFTCCSWRAATQPIGIGMKLIIIYTEEKTKRSDIESIHVFHSKLNFQLRETQRGK